MILGCVFAYRVEAPEGILKSLCVGAFLCSDLVPLGKGQKQDILMNVIYLVIALVSC